MIIDKPSGFTKEFFIRLAIAIGTTFLLVTSLFIMITLLTDGNPIEGFKVGMVVSGIVSIMCIVGVCGTNLIIYGSIFSK